MALKYYLLFINVITFAAYALDKYKAVHGRWRIREATLLGLALIGGSAGALLAMRICRHKTQHGRFRIGVPAMLAVHVVILVFAAVRYGFD